MRFTGELRVPGSVREGLVVDLRFDDAHLDLSSNGEELGVWRLDEVHVARLEGDMFEVRFGDETLTFIADDAISFAYDGVPGIEEAARRLKRRRMLRRSARKVAGTYRGRPSGAQPGPTPPVEASSGRGPELRVVSDRSGDRESSSVAPSPTPRQSPALPEVGSADGPSRRHPDWAERAHDDRTVAPPPAPRPAPRPASPPALLSPPSRPSPGTAAERIIRLARAQRPAPQPLVATPHAGAQTAHPDPAPASPAKRPSLKDAVRARIGGAQPVEHEHVFKEARTVGGIVRRVCEACGYVSIGGEDPQLRW